MRGDQHKASNAFQWDRVLLNMPGTAEHNPALPRVMKIRRDGRLAGELARMVDDLRGVGNDEAHARQVGRTMGATANHMGNQDAARKARPHGTAVLLTRATGFCGSLRHKRSGQSLGNKYEVFWAK
eukprot:scaffold10597_cov43-Attheya_sp.AAC.1